MGFRFGEKFSNLASKVEGASRFGQKALGTVSRIGNKVASTVRGIASGVENVPVLGAVSKAPIIKGFSAQDLAAKVAGGAEAVAGMADRASATLQMGDKLIRTGRELGGARTPGEKIEMAKDMMRQGQQIQKSASGMVSDVRNMRTN